MTAVTDQGTGRPPADQGWLAGLFAERAAWAGGDQEPCMTVQVLLRSFNLADLVYGARAFAAGLTPLEADTWRRSWTKARFLYGNPANLTGRTPVRLIAPAETAAWLGPFPSGRLPGPCRLLKPVSGTVPMLPRRVDIPAVTGEPPHGPPRELHIALRGVSLAGYLVHLHHTLAESVLLAGLRPDEPLRLIHSPDIDTHLARGTNGYARVHYASGAAGDLRLYAWLSPDGPGARP